MSKRNFTFILIYLFSFSFIWAQKEIKGTVVSKTDNEPLIGASVLISGSTQGTITDFDGHFI